ncbi:outer membrane beta-barrel protein [Zhouia sp. PK063]|uniref:outer membrane beta-barrel protein n=1 Tax=Zhouia sp. PK063 TaxID=3373602 RepID=UPI003796CFFE
MKTLLLLFITVLTSVTLKAQIKGKVVDADNQQALAYATLAVGDSLQHKTIAFAYTDDEGNFELSLPKNFQTGILSVRYLGFTTYTKIIQQPLPKTLHISLTAVQNNLSEVTVTSKQKAITIKGDKLIFNIAQSGIGDGNNGLETMQQLPGVSLDKDENLQFRGSTGVQIMINGKKSMLSSDALREYIRSLKGDDIQSVEIIAQPSARYEASGTTGILNIVLKKNRTQHLNGSAYSYASYGDYFKQRYGGRLFYNDSLWNINANGYYYRGKSFNDRNIVQTIDLGDKERKLEQSNYWLPTTTSKSFNIGIERKINNHQLISTEWQFYNAYETDLTTGITKEFDNEELSQQVALTQKASLPTHQITGNLYYNFTSDSATTKIDAQVNYGYYKKDIDGYQQNDYNDTTSMRLDGTNQTKYHLFNTQIDYNQQLTDSLYLEAGAKFAYVNMNYNNQYQTNNQDLLFIPDSLLINDFMYQEHLTSAYSQLSYQQQHWNFMAGLRMENYHYKATSNISEQTNSNSYTNWFPSASVSFKKNNSIYRASYSKRIGRPDYLDLNPYYRYLDAYSLEQGNPNLKPRLYHSFELNYIYKNALNLSLYGYLYKNGFVNVIDYVENDNYNIIYKSNAAHGKRFGFSATLPYQPKKWWTLQLSLDSYLTSEKSEIENYSYDGNGFGYELSLYQKFSLPQKWSVTLNGFYVGKSNTATGISPAIYDMSLSVKKMFWNDKLALNAGCSNFLKQSAYKNISTVGNVTTHWVNKWETRRFYVQLTYNFGKNGNSKSVKETSLSDEKSRM